MTDTVDALANISEMLSPFGEMATGYRKQLEEQGWSPTAAEQASLTVLINLIQKAFNG